MARIVSSSLMFARLASGCLLMLVLGCSGADDKSPKPSERSEDTGQDANEPLSWQPVRNVLLISMDTTRADHLSCYGFQRPTTRNIDALAKQGLQCEMAIAPTPMTLPSHSTMLTGMTPLVHGVHQNGTHRLGPKNVTLAEVLKSNGYRTGAIVSCEVLASRFGLDQGFETYDDHFESSPSASAIAERPGEEVSRLAEVWLANRDKRPFFLFLHYFDPHFTYAPPQPFAKDFGDDLYAGEIAYTDHCIGQVIRSLKKKGLFDSTLIIVTSDHGEMRGEHGETYHSFFIYQGVVRVPLVMRVPGLSRSIVWRQVVGLTDIVPTVCRLLNVALDVETSGQDLMAIVSGDQTTADSRYVYCESRTPTVYGANPLQGLVGSRWKYIQSTRPELYDLADDASETKNLTSLEREQAVVLQDQLWERLESDAEQVGRESHVELDDQTKRRLESIGYVGSQAEGESTFDPTRSDAKDLVDYYTASMEVGYLLSRQDFARARQICLKLVKSHPEVAAAHLSLAEIATTRGEYQDGEEHARKAIEIRGEDAEAHYQLALALQSQEKIDEAIVHYRVALSIQGEKALAHFNLGLALHTQKKLEPAIEHYRKAIQYQDDYGQAHNNLAIALVSVGQRDEAIKHFRQALAIDPDNRAARENLKRIAP